MIVHLYDKLLIRETGTPSPMAISDQVFQVLRLKLLKLLLKQLLMVSVLF